VAVMPVGEDRFRGRLLYPMHVLAVLPQPHRLSRSNEDAACRIKAISRTVKLG
jgi:hypothetical protein